MSDDFAEALRVFQTLAPRLFLDTAVLIEIGDGRIDSGLLDELLDAVAQHAFVLLVTPHHLQDALRPGERDNVARLATALESFPALGVVDRGPDEIEPWDSPTGDIAILPCGNIREILEWPQGQDVLAHQHRAQRSGHAGIVTATGMRRACPDLKVPARLQPVAQYALVMMVVTLEPRIQDLVEEGADALGIKLTAADRDTVGMWLVPVLGLLAHLAPELAALSPDERGRIAKSIFPEQERSPGRWLGGRVSGCRWRNIQREPLPSDAIDVSHVQHFPYVDVATCDRETFGSLQRHVADISGPRRPTVFRNSELRQLVDHIISLPFDSALATFASEASKRRSALRRRGQ